MIRDRPLPAELEWLALRLASNLGHPKNAETAMRLVREHAPEERLALAFLVRLAEQSRAILNRALEQHDLAADLVFCLGSSELVAADLCLLEAGWLEFFQTARAHTTHSIVETLRVEIPPACGRDTAVAELAAFRRRRFLAI